MPQSLPRLLLTTAVALLLNPLSIRAQVLVPRPGVRPVDTIPRAAEGSASANVATHAALALSVSHDSTAATRERKKLEAKWDKLKTFFINNAEWCNPATDQSDARSGLQWCHFYSSSKEANKAAKTFWTGALSEGTDLGLSRMVNLIGNGNAQSAKVELLSDFWSTVRVGLSGVLATKSAEPASTNATNGGAVDASTDAQKQSKAQQFLNGGGPAELQFERPFLVLNLPGSNTVLLGETNLSFSVPSSGNESPADSLQFGASGIRIQTQIDGGDQKISGIANLSLDRVYGGRSFYRAATGDPNATTAFGAASFSVGLVVEQSVQLTWNKIFYGPRSLQQGGSFFRVNVTR